MKAIPSIQVRAELSGNSDGGHELDALVVATEA